jgi:hypothetical protein
MAFLTRFGLRLCDLASAFGKALSLQSDWFLSLLHPSLEGPEPPRRAPNLSPEPGPKGTRVCSRRWQRPSIAPESAWASLVGSVSWRIRGSQASAARRRPSLAASGPGETESRIARHRSSTGSSTTRPGLRVDSEDLRTKRQFARWVELGTAYARSLPHWTGLNTDTGRRVSLAFGGCESAGGFAIRLR